jgi:hypothetical protein
LARRTARRIVEPTTTAPNTEALMPFWMLEVIQALVLVLLALGVQRAIRRSGHAYAAELFEHSPKIGAAFVLLSDIGLYLIFAAYTLFNVSIESGRTNAAASDFGEVVASVGGIALIIGILHMVNIVFLPLLAGIMGGTGLRHDEPGGVSSSGRLQGRTGAVNVTVTLQEAG